MASKSSPYPLTENKNFLSALVGLLVFAACLAGIGTRLFLDLASFWPANALLLSVFLLRPDLQRAATWIAAMLGYVAAEILAGTGLLSISLLNLANLTGIALAVGLSRMLPAETMRLHHPSGAIYAITTLVLASAGSALIGAFAGPILFVLSIPDSLLLWFATELANYAIIFPVAVALGSAGPEKFRVFSRRKDVAIRQVLALVFLGGSILAAFALGGPGALGLALPALVWCAIRFRPATAALLTSATCINLLMAGQSGLLPLHTDMTSATDVSSFRLGIAVLAIMPFNVASLNSAWRNLHGALLHTSAHDALTGLLNRAAFMEQAALILDSRSDNAPISLLMVDVDHFKSINDFHGHPAGDQVLATIGHDFKACLRSREVLGRLGGEEFAVLLPDAEEHMATSIGERLRLAVESNHLVLPSGETITTTVSVGVATVRPDQSLTDLIYAADAALYAAKHGGRNCVVPYSPIAASVATRIGQARA